MGPAARLGVLAACLGLMACSMVASGTPHPSFRGTASVAPSAASKELTVGGTRPATVELPPGDAPRPAPLLIMLHGYGSSSAEHRAYFGLDRYASDLGMLVAYPEGTRDRDGNRFWNGTDACCDLHGSGVDDAGYLVSLVDEVGRMTPVDPKRVYLVGHSNGGFMSYRMACEQAVLFAAIVSLAGATYANDADCAPREPVAILQIHGTGDDTVLFEGGTLKFGGTAQPRTYPGAEATAASWAVYDGCVTAFDTLQETLDIDAGIDGPNGPTETKLETAKSCAPGGHVELWTIPGGSHVPNLSTSFAADVIDFLMAHPKP
jgi:polyhydroxybutyrate depolymerase